jgi:hypothetical protein
LGWRRTGVALDGELVRRKTTVENDGSQRR